jgi:sugar lactone lactonase YvrE
MICISPRSPLTPSLPEANVMRFFRVQSFPGPLFFAISFLVALLASTPALYAQTQAPSAPALTANVQETLLGPSVQAAMFVVSPDGEHYAVPAMRGTHEVVVIDGVDGPEFDHAGHTLATEALDFVFSADGKHSCYVAESGDNMVLVRDGKTAFMILTLKTLPGGAKQGNAVKMVQRFVHNADDQMTGDAAGHLCLMSPSGDHVAVLSNEANASESGATYMFLDGVKSPTYNFIDPNQVAFSAEKLVYAAQVTDHTWRLVVNDQPGPTYTGLKSLLVNDDNSHYAFIGAVDTSGWGVGVDGVLGKPRGDIQDMVLASNGRVSYVIAGHMNGATGQAGNSGLFIDQQFIGTPDHPFQKVDKSGLGKAVSGTVLFSPDGKRVAYVKSVAGGVTPVIDGTVGKTYDSIRTIQFSPDSAHYFYVGSHSGDFVVWDGQEMPREDASGVSNFVFSQTGGSFAYLAKSAQAGTRMVVNGKASPPFYGLIPNSMTFSADGKHNAYAVNTTVSQWQFVRDGVATSVSFLISFTTRTGPPHIDFPPLIFSPDGTRLAWGWGKSDGVSKDVISIDGQEIMHGYSTYEFPQFSPDSKHFAVMIWDANKYSLAIDGNVGPRYDDFLEVNRNVACFLDAHTFRFLGVKNGSVYRVTVSLGG